VWLNEITSGRSSNLQNALHYKSLRVAFKDCKKRNRRQQLDDFFKRATPYKWMRYSNAKTAIQLLLRMHPNKQQDKAEPRIQRLDKRQFFPKQAELSKRCEI